MVAELLIVAVAVFALAMVSARFSMSPITGPMVFTAIGIVVGTGGFGWFDLDLEGEAVAILVGPMLDDLSWRTALYAIASLTVIRMVPVLVAMLGSGTFIETRLFLGWFGPRGLASILFALVVVEGLEGQAGRTIFTVAASTVLASIFLHGLTANGWAGRLAHRLATEPDPMPENEPGIEMPTRRLNVLTTELRRSAPAMEGSER